MPARLRLKQLAADASEQPWLVRAIVASTPRQVVGCVGFHAPPDDDGRVEIGYDIVASERRKGYAREGIQALLDGRGRLVALGPASPPSVRITRPPLPSSARSGSGMSASRSTRSTDWSWSSSGACHSCADRRCSHITESTLGRLACFSPKAASLAGTRDCRDAGESGRHPRDACSACRRSLCHTCSGFVDGPARAQAARRSRSLIPENSASHSRSLKKVDRFADASAVEHAGDDLRVEGRATASPRQRSSAAPSPAP